MSRSVRQPRTTFPTLRQFGILTILTLFLASRDNFNSYLGKNLSCFHDLEKPSDDMITVTNSSSVEDVKVIEPIAPPSKPSNDTETKTTVRLPPSNATTNFGGVHARPFEAWPSNRSLPCVPAETNWSTVKVQISPTQEGFLFVKPYKVGGSTAAGVNIRLARNVAQRQWTNGTVSLPSGTTTEICKNRYDHAQVRTQQYHIRNRMKSFLWSIIRDPTKRAISSSFHTG